MSLFFDSANSNKIHNGYLQWKWKKLFAYHRDREDIYPTFICERSETSVKDCMKIQFFKIMRGNGKIIQCLTLNFKFMFMMFLFIDVQKHIFHLYGIHTQTHFCLSQAFSQKVLTWVLTSCVYISFKLSFHHKLFLFHSFV